MQTRASNSRHAFTLIELLVVISLILVLATLAVLILPRLGDDQKSVRSADQLSMWLLISKQRAYRDQAPRGLRLVPSNDDPTQVRELVYIERPQDYRGGTLDLPPSPLVPVPAPLAPANPPAALMTPPSAYATTFINGKDLTNGNMAVTPGNMSVLVNPPLVEPGDFLVFDTLEIIPNNAHRIAGLYFVPPSGPNTPWGTYLVLAAFDGRNRQVNSGAPIQKLASDQFHIIRRERPMTGEPVLQLPKDMVIDIRPDPLDASGGSMGYSRIPGAFDTPQNLDVVFNQRGQVTGRNSLNGKVILRIRNGSKPEDVGEQFLVTVYTRTGLIAIHPMDLTPSPSGPPTYADPFLFTKDGKTSGL